MVDAASLDVTLSNLNEVLLNIADQLGMDVIILIAFIAVSLALVIIILIGLIRRPSESPIVITAMGEGAQDKNFKYVEKTLAEFPAETVRIEITKGKLVIKLIEAKPRSTNQEKKVEAPKESEARSG